MTGSSIVFVVDDDPSVRSSLKFLISTVGLEVETFESAEAFLQRTPPDTTSCLVLDIRLCGLSGLDCQCEPNSRTPERLQLLNGSLENRLPSSFLEVQPNRVPVDR